MALFFADCASRPGGGAHDPRQIMRKTQLIASILCLLFPACTSGTAERTGIDGAEGMPLLTAAAVTVEEPEVEPSESHLQALQNQPSTNPVVGIPGTLQCDGDPGGKVLHRLNRQEYNNTVRDLVGYLEGPADSFPKDDFGDSFDNNARSLSVNPLLTEGYMEAAEEISRWALSEDNPARDSIISCQPKTLGAGNCATEILTTFLFKAFRRPLLDEEIATYVALVERARELGATFEQGIQTAIEAALLSVNFLYRVELDVDPESAEPHALTQFEVASRLSYFLWSSMPDAELLNAALAGELSNEEQLRAQVTRMLDDDRAGALLDNFVGQWLEIDDIAESNQPAKELFPTYTPSLKRSMEAETRRFMSDIIQGKVPFTELLTREVGYVNAELAEHYGLAGEYGDELEQVSLAGTERAGLLTQASVLTLTGASTRTSPVRRGVYVLTNLLCSAPPPPPPNVATDLDSPDADPTATLADRTRAHTEKPECAGCHTLMDPIGFGLENFDAIGRYRSEENGSVLDPSGELTINGRVAPFSGAQELSALLADDPRLARCATRKLLTYALGRVLTDKEDQDRCRIDGLGEVLEKAQDFQELIQSVTLTDSFRGRRGGLTAAKGSK